MKVALNLVLANRRGCNLSLNSRRGLVKERKIMTSTLIKLGLVALCLPFAGVLGPAGSHSIPARASIALAQQQTELEDQANQDNKLVEAVRNATRQYVDNVKLATSMGYGPALGCVSGSDHGAMGIHYVNGSLLNGPIDVTQPQALIYEPSANGELKLVGVEYIILASALPPNSAPEVNGHLMIYVGYPNRYGLPSAFFELHVWAWRNNPKGAFVDWNDHVTCAHQ